MMYRILTPPATNSYTLHTPTTYAHAHIIVDFQHAPKNRRFEAGKKGRGYKYPPTEQNPFKTAVRASQGHNSTTPPQQGRGKTARYSHADRGQGIGYRRRATPTAERPTTPHRPTQNPTPPPTQSTPKPPPPTYSYYIYLCPYTPKHLFIYIIYIPYRSIILASKGITKLYKYRYWAKCCNGNEQGIINREYLSIHYAHNYPIAIHLGYAPKKLGCYPVEKWGQLFP